MVSFIQIRSDPKIIAIQSYLRHDGGTFTPFEKVKSYEGNPHHAPGAIRFTVDVLTQKLWDDVDWLWPYLILAFDQCHQTGCGQTGLLSQPAQLEIEAVQSLEQLRVSVIAGDAIENQAVGSAPEIYQAVREAGLVTPRT